MIRRLLLLALALSGLACAQRERPPVIYEELFSDLETEPAASAPVTNIGQAQHQIAVRFKNNPPNTCAPHQTDMGFEFRMRNAATWTPFGNRVAFSPTVGETVFVTSNGSFPFVRFNVIDFDTVNCQIDVDYSGSLFPTGQGTHIREPGYTISIGSIDIQVNSTGSPGTPQNITIIPASGRPNQQTCVYGLSLTADAVAHTFHLQDAVSTASFTGVLNLTPNQTWILPQAVNQWFCGGVNSAIEVRSQSTGSLSGIAVFRYEEIP